MTTATLTNKNDLNTDSAIDSDARFGRTVRVIREEVSMSVAELASAIGMSSKRLVAIEQNWQLPKKSVISSPGLLLGDSATDL